MRLAFLFAMMMTLPAQAAPLTSSVCNDLWAFAGKAFEGRMTSSAAMLGGQGCTVRDVEIAGDGEAGTVARIKLLSFRGADLATDGDWLTGNGLTLSIRDLRFVTGPSDQATAWLQNSASGVDVDLALMRDGGDWQIERLDAVFPGGDMFGLNATLAGLDLTSRAMAVKSASTVRLTDLDVTVLMQGGDNGLAQLHAVQSGIGTLLETDLSASSKTALNALLAEMPTPEGTLNLALQSDAGIGAANIIAAGITTRDDPMKLVGSLLSGSMLDVTWTKQD